MTVGTKKPTQKRKIKFQNRVIRKETSRKTNRKENKYKYMRKLENMGSTFIIPGEDQEETETDDMYVDYDYGRGDLEAKPKKSEYSEDALNRVQSRRIGRVAILAGAFELS